MSLPTHAPFDKQTGEALVQYAMITLIVIAMKAIMGTLMTGADNVIILMNDEIPAHILEQAELVAPRGKYRYTE